MKVEKDEIKSELDLLIEIRDLLKQILDKMEGGHFTIAPPGKIVWVDNRNEKPTESSG